MTKLQKSKSICWFHASMADIGGCETVSYNWCQQLSRFYDITFVYINSDPIQLERISHFVKCVQYDKLTKFDFDLCICNTSWGGYPEKVQAKDYWQMMHADYIALAKAGWVYTPWKRTTKHIAVSKAVADSVMKIYKIKCDVIYNILGDILPTRPVINFLSATRLSSEKGWDRMKIFAQMLREYCEDHNCSFRWTIFCNLSRYHLDRLEMEELIYKETTLDIFDYMKEAHYGVQLSDTEGDPLFVEECVQYGTPVIITDFKVANEIIKHGYNGYILPMNMKFDFLDDIMTKIPKDFKPLHKTTAKTWCEFIGGAVEMDRPVTPIVFPKVKRKIGGSVNIDKKVRYSKSLGNARDKMMGRYVNG